jgi:sirohydrochlorin ferrochelatase
VSTGIVVFAHGSRIASANDAVRAVTAQLMRAGSLDRVETAFLELGQPDLAEAAARLVGRGSRRIVVIPYFLTLGTHLERDLPALVNKIGREHKDVEFVVTPPLDGHPALLQILLDRVAAPETKHNSPPGR